MEADALYVAWRDLRFAKGRFALMGTVVVLMTMLVGLISGLTAGLGRGSTSAITGLPADHLAFAAPSEGQKLSFTTSDVSQQQWLQWQAVPGVRKAEPLGVTTTMATLGARTAALSAFGVEPGSGLVPANTQLSPGSVVLSTGAAGALDAQVGQKVTVSGSELRVAGVAGDASFGHTPVIWTSLADWQRMAPAPNESQSHATVIALTTTSGADLAAADQRLHTSTVTTSDSLSAIGSYTSENGSLQLMRGFLFVISALVIGAFFTVWTIQRSGDLAVLKALGATNGYLMRDAIGQAAVLLTAGTAIGAAIAAGLGAVASAAVPFVVDASTVVLPAVVMIVLGVLGAVLAIRRITSIDPLTALGSAR
jgi:putative ABC transport system permease protein